MSHGELKFKQPILMMSEMNRDEKDDDYDVWSHVYACLDFRSLFLFLY